MAQHFQTLKGRQLGLRQPAAGEDRASRLATESGSRLPQSMNHSISCAVAFYFLIR
jgi:hypothetical protein